GLAVEVAVDFRPAVPVGKEQSAQQHDGGRRSRTQRGEPYDASAQPSRSSCAAVGSRYQVGSTEGTAFFGRRGQRSEQRPGILQVGRYVLPGEVPFQRAFLFGGRFTVEIAVEQCSYVVIRCH